MRVLLVHSAYDRSQPSGENNYVRILERDLRSLGVEVELHVTESPSRSLPEKLAALALTVMNRAGVRQLHRKIDHFDPQIVHFHNTFPRFSPKCISLLNDRGVPVIMTIHNFRMGCLNGSFFRKGRVCERCKSKPGFAPGIVRRCYRKSLVGSSAAALHYKRMRKALLRVDSVVAISPVVEREMMSLVPADRVETVRNFSDHPVAVSVAARRRPESTFRVSWLGRLSVEKGAELLVQALEPLSKEDIEIMVAGSGPMDARLSDAVTGLRNAHLLGQLSPSEARELIASSDLVLSLSVGAEAGETLVVHEALASGTPVLVTKGSTAAEWLEEFPSMVCEPAGTEIAERIMSLAADPTGLALLRQEISVFYEREYRSVAAENHRIYRSVLEAKASS